MNRSMVLTVVVALSMSFFSQATPQTGTPEPLFNGSIYYWQWITSSHIGESGCALRGRMTTFESTTDTLVNREIHGVPLRVSFAHLVFANDADAERAFDVIPDEIGGIPTTRIPNPPALVSFPHTGDQSAAYVTTLRGGDNEIVSVDVLAIRRHADITLVLSVGSITNTDNLSTFQDVLTRLWKDTSEQSFELPALEDMPTGWLAAETVSLETSCR